VDNEILKVQNEPTIESMARTIDEVMPLAQCLGALCDYLKNDPSSALAFNPSNNSFVIIKARGTGVYSADFFIEGSVARTLLKALDTWFAKKETES
jgi:hypothetical protein